MIVHHEKKKKKINSENKSCYSEVKITRSINGCQCLILKRDEVKIRLKWVYFAYGIKWSGDWTAALKLVSISSSTTQGGIQLFSALHFWLLHFDSPLTAPR